MIEKIEKISNTKFKKNYQINKPKGVMGRNSDNTLIRSQLSWEPKFNLMQGLEKTYNWIFSEIKKKHNQ
jgi:nucleoside-diphosphate-sugar epimerase